MIISIDWIKDFVDLPELGPKDYYNRFTLACAEVEQVEEKGLHLSKVKVVQITSIRKHPEADKLNLVSFQTAEGAREVVCGASNVRVGLKVPYAPVGTVLPGNFELTPKKIRGILSEGMLCSCEELDIPGSSEGLLELADSAPIGQSMATYLKQVPDVLLHIDNKSLTHRPDLWGHYGLAREFATIFTVGLKRPHDEQWRQKLLAQTHPQQSSPITPQVSVDSSCSAYYGLSVDGVQVGPSPDWMQRRLLAVGLRPINNLVDISNYVMLELGHPLHIFDRDLIKGEAITIKALSAAENFITLDGLSRSLIEGDTVIADAEKTLVLAGIMGGANSGVQDQTSRIFIEVANWKPALTRKTSTRLGLRTESSQRFEKSLDSYQCEKVLLRTLELVLQLCPKAQVRGKVEYAGPLLSPYVARTITCSAQKFARYLGTDISQEKIISILTSLEFKLELLASTNELKISIPSFRATKDVELFDDLVEEVGRVIGFDHIAPRSPRQDVLPVSLSTQQKMARKAQDFLSTRFNAYEIITYPLVGEALLKQMQWPELAQELQLKNALSVDHDRMRPSLIPSLLEKLALNQKHYDQFRFFEIGRSYLSDPHNFSHECWQIALVNFDRQSSDTLAVVNMAEDLLRYLGVAYQLQTPNDKLKSSVLPMAWPGVHPQEVMHVRIMGKMNGAIFTVHPMLLKNLKVRGHASVMVLDLTGPSTSVLKEKSSYRPLPKSQTSHFDLTVQALSTTQAGEVLEALKGLKLEFYQSTKIVDVYSLENAAKSVTLRCVFHDPEQTLSGDFLQRSLQQVIETLNRAGFPLKT